MRAVRKIAFNTSPVEEGRYWINSDGLKINIEDSCGSKPIYFNFYYHYVSRPSARNYIILVRTDSEFKSDSTNISSQKNVTCNVTNRITYLNVKIAINKNGIVLRKSIFQSETYTNCKYWNDNNNAIHTKFWMNYLCCCLSFQYNWL